MRRAPRITHLAFVATLALSAGCGYIGIGVGTAAAVAGGGGGGGGRVDVGSDISAAILPLVREPGGTQKVRVRLADQESRALPLRLELRATDADPFEAAALTAVRVAGGATVQGDGATIFRATDPLPTTPDGITYELDWSFAQDLGAGAKTGVDIQVAIVSSAALAGGVAAALPDQKIGNDAPEVRDVEVIGGSAAVLVRYEIRDSTSDVCRVNAFFRVDGGARTAMGAVDDAEVTGIAAGPAFAERTFIWDTLGEAALVSRESSVVVELVPVDDGLLDGEAATATATIKNGAPSSARITAVPARAVTGTARIEFTLSDAEADPVTVTPQWAIAAGPAGPLGAVAGTAQSALSDPTQALATTSTGRPHSFTWAYETDLGSSAARRVVFTIKPEGTLASPAISPSFVVGNDPPAVTITSLAASGTGDVPISFTLQDSTSDATSVALFFKVPGGSFQPATVSGTTAALAAAAPPAAASAHTITWRSAADLPVASAQAVTLRLEAQDGLPGGSGGFDEESIAITNGAGGPPSISTITPAAGRLSGGTPVTIIGQRFAPGPGATTVEIGGGTLGSIQVAADGSALTGTTPATGTAGPADVVVTTAAGSATLTAAYTYQDGPVVTSIEPAEGRLGTPLTVTILGANFVAGSTATLGGAALTSIQVAADGSALTGTVPATGTAATVSVSVTTPDGTAILPGGFRYLAAPSVGSVAPAEGPKAGGTRVTITGSGFLASAVTVSAGGAQLGTVAVVSDTEITGTMPGTATAAPVSVALSVETRGGAATLSDAFTYHAAPTLGSLLPGFGAALNATTTALFGTGFVDGGTTALVGGVSATAVFVSPTALALSIPPLPAGLYDVKVRTTGGEATLAGAFRSVPPLEITAVTPSKGPTTGGTPLTIVGKGFIPGETTVRIRGVTLAGSPVAADVVIAGGSAPGGAAGSADVMVTTPLATTTSAGGFTYTDAPTIASLTPDEGPLAGGTPLTISGTGFDPLAGATTVTLGGTTLSALVVSSSTTATGTAASAPNGLPGLVTLVVRTEAGEASLQGAFRYLAAPTIGTITPAGGPLSPGTPVVVTGTGFLASTLSVRFGSADLLDLLVLDDTRLLGTTPVTGTAGTVDVVISTAGGVTVTPGFTYVDPPAIAGISPVGGAATGSTFVTITGNGFAPGATEATIGGLPLGAPVTVTAGTITGLTPPGPGGSSVDVVVTTPGGTSTLPDGFTYDTGTPAGGTAELAITPKKGPAAGGTFVTITGVGPGAGTAMVTIGGADLVDPGFVSPSTIIGRTPPGRIGPAAVTVTTGQTTTFTYAPAVTFELPPTVLDAERPQTFPLPIRLVADDLPLGATVSAGIVVTAGNAAVSPPQVTFPAGSFSGALRQATVTVSAAKDFDAEEPEIVELELMPSAGAIAAPFPTCQFTIPDDDLLVTFTAVPSRAFVTETVQVTWTASLPPVSGRLFLDPPPPGGSDVTGLSATMATPFPSTPTAGADPRAFFKLRGTGALQAREEFRLESAATIGDASSSLDLNGVAACADGGAVIVGSFGGFGGMLRLTGASVTTTAGNTDAFVARYLPGGGLKFLRVFGGTGNDIARDVAVLPDGDIVVTGSFSGTVSFGSFALSATGQIDTFVVRLADDATGTVRWAKDTARQSSPTTESPDQGFGVAALPDGTVVVGGVTGIANSSSTSVGVVFGPGEPFGVALTNPNVNDVFVARYAQDGSLMWAKGAGGTGAPPAVGSQQPRLVGFPDGSVVFAGGFTARFTFGAGEPGATTFTAGTDARYFVARYRPDGSLAWAREATFMGSGSHTVTGLAALPDGGVAVYGKFVNNITFDATHSFTGSVDLYLAKYDAAGTVVWAKQIVSDDASLSSQGLTALPDGSLMATGSFLSATFGLGEAGQRSISNPPASGTTVFVARFAADGNFGTVETFSGTAFPRQAAAFPDGRVAVTGRVSGTVTNPVKAGVGEEHETPLPPGSGGFFGIFLAFYEPQTFALAEVRPQGAAWVSATAGATSSEAASVLDTAVSPDGSTLVVGHFQGTVSLFGEPPTSTAATGAFVARLLSDGTAAWVRTGSSPGGATASAVVALGDGSAVVVGTFGPGTITLTSLPTATASTLTSLGGSDVFAVRYDRDGKIVWARRGGGTGSDSGLDVAAYPDGSVLLTGALGSATLASFNASPGLTGDRTTGLPALQAGAFVVRYRANGTLDAQNTITGTDVIGRGVATLPSGAAVVVGTADGTLTLPNTSGGGTLTVSDADSGGDGFVAYAAFPATTSPGHILFTAGRYIAPSGPGSVIPRGVAIVPTATAAAGTAAVLVVGSFEDTADFGGGVTAGPAAGQDAFIAWYDPAGTPLTARAVGDSGIDSFDAASPLPDGSAVVLGGFENTVTLGANEPNATPLTADGKDVVIARYRPDGSLLWACRAGGASDDAPGGVAAHPDGGFRIGGRFAGSMTVGLGDSFTQGTGTKTGASNGFVARYYFYPEGPR